jgi:hypothetical protein
MRMEELFLEHISGRIRGAISRAGEYYLKALEDYDGSFKFISWNWSACFGTIYWLVYRCLYKYALIFLGVKAFIAVVFPRLGLIFFALPHIFLGIFGTTLYLDFVADRIRLQKQPLGTDGNFALLIFAIVEVFSIVVYSKYVVG